jgi:16S rRNA (adenine1518-N6/adenine1519-N6)-dimethyltransferase
MVTVVAEKGYEAATVAEAVRRARVSRGTFYELFESKEACLADAYRLGNEVLEARVHEAVREAAAAGQPPTMQAAVVAGPGRLEIVEADALAFDPRPLLGPGPVRVVANLPYNIGTGLLTGWVAGKAWPPWWSSLTLMFQREVAERIVADESDPRNYGRLGVLCGWRTEARILFDVPPSAFVPPPKVTSSVVHLVPRAEPLPCRIGALEAVTRAAFGQRRKMLRQSLRSIAPAPAEILSAAGLAETSRAEDVPVAGYVALANAWDAMRG